MPKKKTATDAPHGSGDRRRQDLLDAAFALVAEKGLEGLRTRDIAARAGVNISTLHYYFGTKDALVVALVAHVNERFTAGQTEREEGLAAHFASAWRSFEDNPNLGTVLLELVIRAHRDPSARAAFRETYKYWNLEVERVLRESVARGEARADLDPRAGAAVVTSMVIGAMTQLGVNPRAFRFADVAAEVQRWVGPPARKRRHVSGRGA